MRVSKEQAAQNREKILQAASKLFRERGLSGVGVDALADAARMSHGSVYSQFGSKDRMAAEAVRFALEETAERFARVPDLKSYVTKYLSLDHRDSPGGGCALIALGSEVPRSSPALRSQFSKGLLRMIDLIKSLIGQTTEKDRDERAYAAAATMVGAMVLARAVDDPGLAENILKASRKSVLTSCKV
jgi:TetR/AcrR family transcriptional regulator, transcriptional repressor for nem operon